MIDIGELAQAPDDNAIKEEHRIGLIRSGHHAITEFLQGEKRNAYDRLLMTFREGAEATHIARAVAALVILEDATESLNHTVNQLRKERKL